MADNLKHLRELLGLVSDLGLAQLGPADLHAPGRSRCARDATRHTQHVGARSLRVR